MSATIPHNSYNLEKETTDLIQSTTLDYITKATLKNNFPFLLTF